MATIGLKVNQGEDLSGLNLADTLSKAMFGDPERETALRLAREREKLYQAQVDKLRADTGFVGAKTNTENYQLQTGREAGDAAGSYYRSKVTPPVPVELPRPSEDMQGPMMPAPISKQQEQEYQDRRAYEYQRGRAIGASGIGASPDATARGFGYGEASEDILHGNRDQLLRGNTLIHGLPTEKSVTPDGLPVATPSTAETPSDFGNSLEGRAHAIVVAYKQKAVHTQQEEDAYHQAQQILAEKGIRDVDGVPHRFQADGTLTPLPGFTPKISIDDIKRKLLDPNQKITPREFQVYDEWFTKTYPFEGETVTKDGVKVRRYIQTPPPSSVWLPEDIRTRVGDATGSGPSPQIPPRPPAVGAPPVPPGVPAPIDSDQLFVNPNPFTGPGAPVPVGGGNALPDPNRPQRPPVNVDLGPQDETAPNDSVGNARMYAPRMISAEAYLQKMAPEAGVVPFLDSLAAAPGDKFNVAAATAYIASPNANMAISRALLFTMGLLRIESGASISNGEFINKFKELIPMPGDTPAQLEGKREARIVELNGVLGKAAAGNGAWMQKQREDAKFYGVDLDFRKIIEPPANAQPNATNTQPLPPGNYRYNPKTMRMELFNG